jgi:hypothetical protein
MKKAFQSLIDLIRSILRRPKLTGYEAATLAFRTRGTQFGSQDNFNSQTSPNVETTGISNPLIAYCASHQTGPGLFKWEHYFEIYDRYLHKFVGREVHLLEVGIYSGGSLQMWRHYLGKDAHIYGVDIEEACRAYEDTGARIFIGDQSDRKLWQRLKREAPTIDILIDDGGHLPEQQIITFEEMLPHIRPGGVYICEDIHGRANRFAAYVHGFASNLHTASFFPDEQKELSVVPSHAQANIQAIHEYPFAVVIEINPSPRRTLQARRRGSEWQPYL